jgi:hypothetical protein
LFFASLVLGQFGAIPLFPGGTIYIHDGVLLFMLMLFTVKQRRRLHVLDGQLIKPIGLFVGIGIISLLINTHQFSVLEIVAGSMYLIRFALYAGLYVYVVNTKVPSIFWQKSLYFVSVAFALLGFVQYWYYPSLRNLLYLGWDEHLYRLFSTLLDPNYLGIILAIGLLLGFLIQTHLTRLFFFTQMILATGLVLTVSRSSLLALVFGLLTFFVLTKNKLPIFIGIVGLVAFMIFPTRGVDTNRLLRINSSVARIENVQQGFKMFLHSPVIGIGFNTMRAQAAREKVLDANGIISRDASGVNTSILFVLITTGMMGGLSYGYILYSLLSSLQGKRLLVQATAIGTITALLIHSFFNNSLFYPWIMLWIWVLWGSIEVEKKSKKVYSL